MTRTGTAVRNWSGEAPAKINLVLRVLAQEASGYHQIETLFQALELADEVALEGTAEAGVHLEVRGVPRGALGPDEENLAVRAARAYLEALGDGDAAAAGFRISLSKRIPHGAGLGGGSSDAGAVLRGLDALHGGALGPDRLAAIGARLGADVAFFTQGAARALAWGRGERLFLLPALSPREVVLACPPEPVATPWAYRALAQARAATGGPPPDARVLTAERLGSWEAVARRAGNDFQEVLEPGRPELAALREALAEAGAEIALLAGSGSTVFGVFADRASAEAGAAAVARAHPSARVLRTRTRGNRTPA